MKTLLVMTAVLASLVSTKLIGQFIDESHATDMIYDRSTGKTIELDSSTWSNPVLDADASEGYEGTEPSQWTLFGEYLRTRIYQTTQYPYRTAGRLDSGCTGTLVGPKHVLTAAHCVWDRENSVWRENLNFSPARNGNQYPYDTIRWTYVVAPKGYTEDSLRKYDFAMVILDKDIGQQVGWMGFGYDANMSNIKININGYPGDKPRGTLWHVYCPVAALQTQRMYYRCDTYGGMSGSAIYRYQKSENKRRIYGIHTSSGSTQNGGVRINQKVFERILGWKDKY